MKQMLDPTRVENIFAEVLARPPDERAAWLEQACAGDAELCEQVEQLLNAHLDVTNALPLPAVPTAPSPVESAGVTIGRYKLLEQIGEGGFGVVFMAEQEHPVRRRVALKIIKLGMDTRQVVARFEAERQALAMMDHANVARVIDAGATDTGRPYFVMELVKGVPITEYCDTQKLPIDARLKLFEQVCQAVQHAHQKGIIHRDLKPTNVLVATLDDRPVAKVIDFGIAKATQARLTERTLFTEFRQWIGTPQYMSPEQADGILDVDTRSDVYGLGVLLYELLTGTTPFEAKELREKAYEEMRRIIREVEPPRPSTRLSTLKDSLSSVAAQRAIEPRKLNTLLRGELDWIVMRCLEKERDRRYQSAGTLAEDVGRYLTDRPVEARPVARIYRVRKFIRRNKVIVFAGLAVFAALLTGITLASIGFVQANRQARIARAEALRADNEANKSHTQAARSEQIAVFLKEMLQAVGPSVALGRDTKMLREIADRTAERMKMLKNQPEVEADMLATLGKVYFDLGEVSRAVAMHREALRLRRALHGPEHPDIAASLDNLGEALREEHSFDEAEVVLRQALAMRRTLYGHEHPDTARTLCLLGLLFNGWGRPQDAEPNFREALALQRKHLRTNDAEIAWTLQQLGLALVAENKLEQAEAINREALVINRKLPGPNPMLAHTLQNLAYVLRAQEKYEESNQLFREAMAIRRQQLGPSHYSLADTIVVFAESLRRQRKLDEAESLSREGLEMRKKLFGENSSRLASPLFILGRIAEDRNMPQEAERFYLQALSHKPANFEFPPIRELQEALARVRK